MAVTLTRQQNARIPAWALPYLINQEVSGLSSDDFHVVEKWLRHWQNEAITLGGHLVISPLDEREFFTKYPEFGLACDCVECDIIVLG